jgi:hypothetical protein
MEGDDATGLTTLVVRDGGSEGLSIILLGGEGTYGVSVGDIDNIGLKGNSLKGVSCASEEVTEVVLALGVEV